MFYHMSLHSLIFRCVLYVLFPGTQSTTFLLQQKITSNKLALKEIQIK